MSVAFLLEHNYFMFNQTYFYRVEGLPWGPNFTLLGVPFPGVVGRRIP